MFSMVSTISLAAYDPEAGRCSKDAERDLVECNDGTSCVWHYLKGDPDTGRKSISWCYKSREEAERARENAHKLCETVSRYWDKTSCRTTFSAPFCKACGNKSDRKGCESAQSSGLNPSELVFEAARGAQDFSTRLPIWERAFPGSTTPSASGGGPYTSVGTVVSGYADALKHAKRKLDQLSCIAENNVDRSSEVFENFRRAVSDLREKEAALPAEHTDSGFGGVSIKGWVIKELKEGIWKGTAHNGTQVEEPYRFGKRHGILKIFYTDGSRAEWPYNYGVVHGWVKRYAANGTLIEQTELKNGEHTYNSTLWESNGSGRKVVVRVNRGNSRFEEYVYWRNGSLRARTTFLVVPEGDRTALYNDGTTEAYYEGYSDSVGDVRWRIEYRAEPQNRKSRVFNCRYFNTNGMVTINKCSKMPQREMAEDLRWQDRL